MKEKQTFKIDNVFIQKVTKPKLDKNGTLLLTTGNGTISCKIMNNTYKRNSKIINGIRKNKMYKIIAIKNNNDCYLQEIENVHNINIIGEINMLYCYYYLRDSISRLEYLEKVFKKQIENPKKILNLHCIRPI